MKGSAIPRSRAVATLVHDIDVHTGEPRIVMLEGTGLTSVARFCAEVWAEVRPSSAIDDDGVTAIRMVMID